MSGKTCFISLLDHKIGGGDNAKKRLKESKVRVTVDHNVRKGHDHIDINYDDKDFVNISMIAESQN